MARITVEDCVQQIPNRFDLVIHASKRARRLVTGAAEPCLDWENDKATVLALREIAAGFKFTDEDESAANRDGNFSMPKSEANARNILGAQE